MQNEVRSPGNVRARRPARFGVAVTKLGAHVFPTDKGRVTDNELNLRPSRALWVHLVIKPHLRVRIRDFLACAAAKPKPAKQQPSNGSLKGLKRK